jgi:signal transduction histidine kinase
MRARFAAIRQPRGEGRPGREIRHRFGAEAVLALVASLGVFASSATLVALPLPHVHVVVVGMLYMLVVLAVARFWGIAYAVPVGVACVVALDWYHIPPTHPSRIPSIEEALTLGVYLVTGIALGQLAAHAHRSAVASELARSALADEQAALRRVATMVARELSPAEVFATVTREVALLLNTDVTSMLRYETDGSATVVASQSRSRVNIPLGARLTVAGDNVAAIVLRSRRPARVDNGANATGPLGQLLHTLGIRSSAGSPIVVEGRLWGVMVAGTMRPGALPERTESRIGEFTELVATAIANAEARAELRASRARLVTAGDETRRRLERNLHDGAQQRLVSLALDLQAIEASSPRGAGNQPLQLSRIREGLAGVLDDLREISQGIHPAILTEGGLRPALQALARRSAVPVVVDVNGANRLAEQVEVAIYYVVSEALTNTAKHAAASVVHVNVETDGPIALLSICDDGIGGADFYHGTGLVGLRDRVEALGGRIEISSPAGSGTSVTVRLPAEREGALTFG